MKILVKSLLLLFLFSSPLVQAQQKQLATDFSFQALLTKEKINLSDYKGKVILVVNTASKCGYTKQYNGLEKLYQKYKSRGFVVIAVPSRDFWSQEYKTSEEIAQFIKEKYPVSFPVTERESVKDEKDAHPFYVWARKELGDAAAPKWNFHKYLINKKGELIRSFSTSVKPDSEELLSAIEDNL